MEEVIVALCLGFIQYAEHSKPFRGFPDCWAYFWRCIRGSRAINISASGRKMEGESVWTVKRAIGFRVFGRRVALGNAGDYVSYSA